MATDSTMYFGNVCLICIWTPLILTKVRMKVSEIKEQGWPLKVAKLTFQYYPDFNH